MQSPGNDTLPCENCPYCWGGIWKGQLVSIFLFSLKLHSSRLKRDLSGIELLLWPEYVIAHALDGIAIPECFPGEVLGVQLCRTTPGEAHVFLQGSKGQPGPWTKKNRRLGTPCSPGKHTWWAEWGFYPFRLAENSRSCLDHEWHRMKTLHRILVELQRFGIPLLLLLELRCVHKECVWPLRAVPADAAPCPGVCREREWGGSARDQLSQAEHHRLQNCCEGKGHPRVQTQQHEVFLNSLLREEQEEFPADFPLDSGLLPGFKIHLRSCRRARAHDAEIGGLLLRELSSTCKQGWAFYRERRRRVVSCGRCSVSHTLHDTAFLPGNWIAGTDEHISAQESPFVLANTPKHFTFWKLFW